jgi:hypothetical protein
MAARQWTALLVLAAVFAMHGVQCAAAADGGYAATPAADAFSLARTALTPGHAHATATAGTGLADPMAAVPNAGHADSLPATPGDAATATAAAGHGGASHNRGLSRR